MEVATPERPVAVLALARSVAILPAMVTLLELKSMFSFKLDDYLYLARRYALYSVSAVSTAPSQGDQDEIRSFLPFPVGAEAPFNAVTSSAAAAESIASSCALSKRLPFY